MKNLAFITILCISLLTISLEGFNQENYIIAGHTDNLLFTDIQDTCLSTFNIIGLVLEYDIDINQDNDLDFQIAAYYSTGASHTIEWIRIEPYNNNKIAFSDSVPAWNPEDTVFYSDKVRGLNMGDTINDNIVFINDIMYLKNNSALPNWQLQINWGNYEYIPVILETVSIDSMMYGWIKVICTSYDEITIESFAVETLNNTIDLFESDISINIFPNPARNFIRLKSSSQCPITMIKLFSSVGKEQNIEIEESDLLYEVFLENIPQGIYILEFKVEDKIYYKKIIKN